MPTALRTFPKLALAASRFPQSIASSTVRGFAHGPRHTYSEERKVLNLAHDRGKHETRSIGVAVFARTCTADRVDLAD